MKPSAHAVALVLATAVPALAQTAIQQPANTGVAHPDPVIINTTPDETVTVKVAPAKPSAAIPAAPVVRFPASSTTETYAAYVPYHGATLASATPAHAIDPDSQIVTSVPETAGEVREGTLFHVKVRQPLSTLTTTPGSRFSAELTAPVEKQGRVVLPIGSVLEGRVTEVRSGRRISGRALLHLEPRSITLPDGSHYSLRAQLIDSDRLNNTAVDQEGSLVRKDHPKETLAIIGATTGTAAVAGGLIGGGVGAVVGAGIGAGASTVVWLKQDRQAELPADARLIFSLTEPMPMQPVEGAANDVAVRSPMPTSHGSGTVPATEQ